MRINLNVPVFLSALLTLLILNHSHADAQVIRKVSADVRKASGELNRSFATCIGAGRANEGLRADWQRQLSLTKKECDFQYIRFHGLLSDDMGVYKEDRAGNPIYNWQYIDELFDFLLSIKVKPFVELGFMPDALASGKKTVFWWKGNITPPKDMLRWKALIKQLLMHWKERYGQAEVRTWYFEVWNEPNLRNLFFTGSQEDYFKLYEQTALAIKEVDPLYRVGGPATAGNGWIPEFISYCAADKVPVDFISTHDYGVKQGFLDLTGNVGTIINPDKSIIANHMLKSRAQINNSQLPKLQLHYTEWSSSYTPTDPIHDTYEEAAYILNTVKRAGPSVNSMSYWTFTDIFEELGPRMTPFHGGFGLLNYQDIKKPAYYAFKYLNELGDHELKTDDPDAIITQDGQGKLSALIWDCTIDHPGDSTNNQVYYRKEHPAKKIGQLKVSLNGLKPGTYQLATYKIGYKNNDAYTSYLGLGSPAQLSREDVAKIRKENSGEPISVETISIANSGVFEKTYELRENDVYFLKLSQP